MQGIETAKFLHILGLKPGATWEEVKDAHKFWTSILHPDVTAAQGKAKSTANDMFAQMNDAKDNLRKWFEDHPESKETPGDIGSAEEAPQADQHASDSDAGPMDWQDWQQTQRDRYRQEQARVVEDEISYLQRRKTESEIRNRKNIIGWARIVAGTVLVFMFIGQHTGNHDAAVRRAMALQEEDARYQYARSTPGAFGPVPLTYEQIESDHRQRVHEIEDANGGGDFVIQVLTLAALGGFVWSLKATAPRERIQKWIQEG